jgi:hypothetical protein
MKKKRRKQIVVSHTQEGNSQGLWSVEQTEKGMGGRGKLGKLKLDCNFFY